MFKTILRFIGPVMTVVAPYKMYILIAGVLSILIGMGTVGYKIASNACKADKLKAVSVVIQKYENIRIEDRKAEQRLLNTIKELREESATQQETIDEYAKTNPTATRECLDNAGVQLFNSF